MSSPQPPEKPPSYPVRWIMTSATVSTPIVMQSSNGPCALLALANSLLQTRAATLPHGTTSIEEPYLKSLLAEYVSTQPSTPETAAAIADFLDILPVLNRGLHMNVRFNSPVGFEFTRELSVFDVFPSRLLHGWLVDPQDVTLANAVSALSYNQLLDELVRTEPFESTDLQPSAPPPEAFSEPEEGEVQLESETTMAIRQLRPAVMQFLDDSATQITIYGLAVLHDTMRDGETAVLFRNSHFYVLRKHKAKLYTLVTDEGYLRKDGNVWEQLMDISGESIFCDGQFRTARERAAAVARETSTQTASASSTTSRPRSQPAPSRSPSQPCSTTRRSSARISNSSYATRPAGTAAGGGPRAKDTSCVIQ